jgi:hypothetical protein
MKLLLFALFVFASSPVFIDSPTVDDSVNTKEAVSFEETTSESVAYGYWTEGCGTCCGGIWACAVVKPGINE